MGYASVKDDHKIIFFKENRRIIVENAAMIALKTHGGFFGEDGTVGPENGNRLLQIW